MKRFGFVIHPIKAKDAARKYPIAKYLPDGVIEMALRAKSPFIAGHVTGVESLTGAKTEGWLVICPLTPDMMINRTPLEKVYEKIVQCGELVRAEGADIFGLGAFTSVVGDGGITIAENSKIAVTTGNSYTVATAIQGTLKACDLIGLRPEESTLAVVGATGSIGKTCAEWLGNKFAKTLVIGRDPERTAQIASRVRNGEVANVSKISEADVVITVTSAGGDVVFPEHLKQGAIVCDVSRPRDVSVRVAKERPDVLVIEGGVVRVPGQVDFGFDFGFPPKTAYACMSETIMLALEEKIENFTLGKEVSLEKVQMTMDMAEKHGFKLDGFRSFEKEVTSIQIDRAKKARLEMISRSL